MKKDKSKRDARVENVVKVLKMQQEAVPEKVTPITSAKKKPKKTAVDKIQGRKKEIVAKAIISCETAVEEILKAFTSKDPTVRPKFRDGPAAVSALARVAQTLADLTMLTDDGPNGLADTTATRERVLAAFRKLPG